MTFARRFAHHVALAAFAAGRVVAQRRDVE
jgi:hypothetical protein